MKSLRILKYVGFGILGSGICFPCHIRYHESLELAYTSIVPWSGINLLADCRTVPAVEDTAYRCCSGWSFQEIQKRLASQVQ